MDVGNLRPRQGALDDPRVALVTHGQLRLGDGALEWVLGLPRVEVFARHVRGLEPPDLRAAAMLVGDLVQRILVVGGLVPDEAGHAAGQVAQPAVFAHWNGVERNQHVVIGDGAVSARQRRPAPVAEPADALGPEELPSFPIAFIVGDLGVEVGILIPLRKTQRAGMGRIVGHLGGEVERVLVIRQIARGHSGSSAGIE